MKETCWTHVNDGLPDIGAKEYVEMLVLLKHKSPNSPVFYDVAYYYKMGVWELIMPDVDAKEYEVAYWQYLPDIPERERAFYYWAQHGVFASRGHE